MEAEAAGKELLCRMSVAAQSLEEGGGRPTDDMESLLADVRTQLDPSSSSGQDLLEIVGIDMPSILFKLAVIPDGSCGETSKSILKTLLESCDPRDMFAAYMEALHLYSEPETLPLCPIILDGLPKIFTRLRRRRLEYCKESFPGLLRIAGLAVDTDRETLTILDKMAQFVMILLDISEQEKVQDEGQNLREAVGVFILLFLARLSEFEQLNDSDAVQSVLMQLAKLLPTCGLSYVDMIVKSSLFEDCLDSMSEDLFDKGHYILNTRQGAALAVWWRFCFKKATIDDQEVMYVVDAMRNSRHAFVSALSNVSILLNSKGRTWRKVDISISLLTSLLEWSVMPSTDNLPPTQSESLEPEEFLKLKYLLQVVQNVVIFSPQSRTRQQAYGVLVNIVRKVLPPSERFEALKQLIVDCEHSSMVSLLIYLVKEEADKALDSSSTTDRGGLSSSPFASEQVLELVAFVLRPPAGGPPDFLNHIDAVLSALNLYRFLLIKETTGKSNYTGVLTKARLQEACSNWLQPLRAVLGGFRRGCPVEDSESAADILLCISNVEGVLYRCLELTEAALQEHGG